MNDLYSPSFEPDARLTPDDEAAVDALVDANYQLEAVPAPHRSRAAVAWAIMTLTEHYPESKGGADVVRRTLLFIATYEADRVGADRDRLPFRRARLSPPVSEARPLVRRWSWTEVGAAAAAVLLMIGVAAPMLAQSRDAARRQACRVNLRDAAIGFTNYAAAFDGALPMRLVEPPDGNWMSHSNAPGANAANLFHLAALGYTRLENLACAANARAGTSESLLGRGGWEECAQVSFSFQNPYGPRPAKWDQPERIAILADKNPVLEAARRGDRPDGADVCSTSHNRPGQNVLFNDGSATWLESAIVGDDNIWLPRDQDEPVLTGVEAPVDSADAMLTH